MEKNNQQTEEDKFQRNVETVTKALKERSAVSLPQQEALQLYQKFSQTRQEPVRLAVALRGFFLKETEQDQRDAYETYLRGRIRPAVEALIEEEDVEKMQILEELGCFGFGRFSEKIGSVSYPEKRLFVAQCVDGVEHRGFLGRVPSEEDACKGADGERQENASEWF